MVANELRLKAGVTLDYETKTIYAVTLIAGSDSVYHTFEITDVDESPTAIAHCLQMNYKKYIQGLELLIVPDLLRSQR